MFFFYIFHRSGPKAPDPQHCLQGVGAFFYFFPRRQELGRVGATSRRGSRRSRQGCIKFLIPPPCGGGGGLSNPFGKNFKLWRGEGQFKGFWEEYHMEKRERESNIICFIILGCREDYLVGKRGRGLKFWGRKSNCRELHTPLVQGQEGRRQREHEE